MGLWSPRGELVCDVNDYDDDDDINDDDDDYDVGCHDNDDIDSLQVDLSGLWSPRGQVVCGASQVGIVNNPTDDDDADEDVDDIGDDDDNQNFKSLLNDRADCDYVNILEVLCEIVFNDFQL